VNNLILQNNATVVSLSESICTGTTVYSGCNPVASISDTNSGGGFAQDIALARTSTAAVQFTMDVILPFADDSFGVGSFDLGFDETAPEPSTFLLIGAALAGIAVFRRKLP
jgi:hypothetical protein